jgi:hypothetical protein
MTVSEPLDGTLTTPAIGNPKPPDEQIFLQAMYKGSATSTQHEALRQQAPPTFPFGAIAALGATVIGM